MEKDKKIPYRQKVALDMSNLYLDTSSPIHCDKCKERLGILRTLRYALFKPKGTAYYVPCKSCKHPNERIKGQYKQNISKQWKELQTK